MKLAVGAWYGNGNVGDELLMCSVVKAIQQELPHARVTVLSATPRAATRATGCPALPPLMVPPRPRSLEGGRALARYFLRTGLAWPRLVRGLDALVLGGGTLLNDRHPRTLAVWLNTVRLYKRLGVRVFFYGVSIGNIRDPAGLDRVRSIFLAADGCALRDRPSVEYMRGRLPEDRLVLSADPVLGLMTPRPAPPAEWPPARPLRIGLTVRQISSIPVATAEREGVGVAAALLDKLDCALTFVPHQQTDVPLATYIRDHLPPHLAARFEMLPYDPGHLDAHVRVFETLDLLVSMRLHPSILAVLHGVPVVGLDCNPKIRGFLGEVGLGEFVSPVSDGIESYRIDGADVVDRVSRLIGAWPRLHADTMAKLTVLRERERRNMAALRGVLDGGADRV